jgi:two-component system sensor histidine kinase YesM
MVRRGMYMKRFLIPLDNVSIRRKFIMVYILGICLPLVVGAIIWMGFTSREIRQNTTHYLDQTYEKTVNDFNILTQTAVNIANQINADESILQDLSTSFSTPKEHYELYWNYLKDRFNMYLISNPEIAGITLYVDDPHFLNTDYFRVLDDTIHATEWYRTASASSSDIIIYPGSTMIAVSPYPNRLTVIRKINSPEYRNNVTNYLLIELNLNRIISELNQEKLSTDTYITYAGDKIFWGPRYIPAAGPAETLELPSEREYYIFQKPLGIDNYFTGWKITGIYDKNQIFSRQMVVLAYFLLITLSLAGLSFTLIWFILKSMRYRLLALAGHMKNIGEDHFDPLLLDNPGQDEIGWLITAFNKMIGDINELINVVYKLEMQKKDIEVENIRAEYKYLQAQVDPHFLFNTLNAVLVFCYKNNYTELTAVISSLSKLLKRLLTSGSDLVTVSEEFDFIEKYLSIEKFRFGGRFEYEIHISQEVIDSQLQIPKMSIQPIVENACKHGLQSSMDDKRRLVLRADIRSGSLVISVKDNGTGMDAQKVASILRRMEDPQYENGDGSSGKDDNGSGVGMMNVYRRMMMNYNKRFHFIINSEPGWGTEIIMQIDEV